MSKELNRFDVAAKELIWEDPEGWLDHLGIGPRRSIEVIEAEITTLTASADKVVRVDGPPPYLVNIELQASHDPDLVPTLWYRQAALDHRHRLPVLTVLVLLRKEANSPSLTGEFERVLPSGRRVNWYNYDVVRAWREPAESFLNASVGVVPLAPLGAVDPLPLPDVVRRMAARINALPPMRAAKVWTATYLLMGLRYEDAEIDLLLEGVHNMRESTTYQKILNEGRAEGRVEGRLEGRVEGRAEGALALLVHQGSRKFGAPDPAVLAHLLSIQDLAAIEALGDRLLEPDVRDWDQLLGLH